MNHFNLLDVLTIFVSAVCHDLEHPGLTNSFQVNSGSDLSLVYNDKSVLENHHAHVAAIVLKQPDTAILGGLSDEERNKVRKSMIGIILHTDMSYHQDIVSQLLIFKNKLLDRSLASGSAELRETDKQFLREAIVHLGDLSNPVMRWDQSHEWSMRVIDEFIAQSNLENEQKLKKTMSAVTDKTPESVSKVQISFIDYVVIPLWKNASNIVPELEDRLVVLNNNKKNWIAYPQQYEQLRKKESRFDDY